jgi:muramoyltetrapeptide carboxypeptidase LdcA involved in peptidoglycan recycling
LGERGILGNIKGVLVGRPKAWEFNKKNSDEEKEKYKREQREVVLEIVRKYNKEIPIVQNLDFGHTAPQICLPSRGNARILSSDKKIYCTF